MAARCESCGVIHGEVCLDCTREECLLCSGSYFIDEGVCKPCTEKPGCLSCDDDGCLECEAGFYLFKQEGQLSECRKCSDDTQTKGLCGVCRAA